MVIVKKEAIKNSYILNVVFNKSSYSKEDVEEMEKQFKASLDQLHEMITFIKGTAEGLSFDQMVLSRIELVSEEVLVNIISYAYPKDSPGLIYIECSHPEPDMIKIVVKDQGIAFNPLKNMKEKNDNLPLEERELGGFGIYFLMQIMDKVEYARVGEFNVLSMEKSKDRKEKESE